MSQRRNQAPRIVDLGDKAAVVVRALRLVGQIDRRRKEAEVEGAQKITARPVVREARKRRNLPH
jgi:hypothetical protein